MPVYIVTRNEQPYCATFSECEACAIFDSIVYSGQFRPAAVLSISASEGHRCPIHGSRPRALIRVGRASTDVRIW